MLTEPCHVKSTLSSLLTLQRAEVSALCQGLTQTKSQPISIQSPVKALVNLSDRVARDQEARQDGGEHMETSLSNPKALGVGTHRTHCVGVSSPDFSTAAMMSSM